MPLNSAALNINDLTAKTTPAAEDEVAIYDFAGGVVKKVTRANWGPGVDTDAIHDNVASEISALTEKTTPVNADLLIGEDSENSNSKVKIQVGNLPGGSDADQVAVVFTTSSTSPYMAVTAGSWAAMGTLGFGGTTALGSPASIKAVGYNKSASQNWSIRVYDVTNSQVICSATFDATLTATLNDLGTLSNLSAGEAVWEVQGQKGTGEGRLCGLVINF